MRKPTPREERAYEESIPLPVANKRTRRQQQIAQYGIELVEVLDTLESVDDFRYTGYDELGGRT